MKNIITFENISKWPESKNGLIYIICISLMLKAFLLASDSLVNNDGLLYISAAQEFAKGHFKEGLAVFPMPFYSLLIAIVHFLIPNWAMAARMLSASFIVFTLIPLYLLTKELFDRKAAFWACLAFALAPASNSLADSVIRDPGFIFCTAWSVYFALRGLRSPQIIFFAATAFFSWTSILFRIEGVALALFYPVFFIVLTFMKNQEKKSFLKGALLFILVPLFIVIILYYLSGLNGQVSFNRSNDIYMEIHKLFKMEFLDNYKNLSSRLEDFVQTSPFPGFKNNFGEIAKHYIPVIYFMGLFETYIIALFPIFIVPLIFSFNGPKKSNHLFVLSLLAAFILVAYYFLIKMDFLTSRYLSIPVFLTYPWVGNGMQRFFEYLSGKFSKKIFAAIFVLFFMLPVYQCVEQELQEDRSLLKAAKWIANNPDAGKFRILTGDKRFLLYAGRDFWVGDAFSAGGRDAYFNLDNKDAGYNELERVAVENKFDLVFLRLSLKKEAPKFNHFKKLKEFKGSKNISYIFSSPETTDKIKEQNVFESATDSHR